MFGCGLLFGGLILNRRFRRKQRMEGPVTLFPSEKTTPPVTKIYFGAIRVARVPSPGLSALHRIDVHTIMFGTRQSVKSNSWQSPNDILSVSRRETFPCETGLYQLGILSLVVRVQQGVAGQEISVCAHKPWTEMRHLSNQTLSL